MVPLKNHMEKLIVSLSFIFYSQSLLKRSLNRLHLPYVEFCTYIKNIVVPLK